MRVSGGLLMGLLVLTVGVTAATPEASGRWKLGGDGGCYFDATDSGPDQCAPVSSAPTEIEADDSLVLLGVSDVRVSTDRPGRHPAKLRQRPAPALAA